MQKSRKSRHTLSNRQIWPWSTKWSKAKVNRVLPRERTCHSKHYWNDWCWSWNSNTLATCCEELTHWKRPWCWERLRAGGEGDGRGWDGWMASPTQWTWVCVDSRKWWWTGRPGVLRFMGSQRVGHDWVTEINRTESLGFPWFAYFLDSSS